MYNGGDILGSGGYGCIISPALDCQRSKKPYNGVSKLMLKKHANVEFGEYKTLTPIIKKIPNYKNYFLLGQIKKCVPRELPLDEFEHNRDCDKILGIKDTPLSSEKLREYLDQNKDNYFVLQMPNGGISLASLIERAASARKLSGSENLVVWLCAKLKDLLKNAVVPMNKLGVIHNDIKTDNILTIDDKVRLVDWGLTFEIPPAAPLKKLAIPYRTTRYVIQFNLPFSNILFSMITSFDDPRKMFHKMSQSRENLRAVLEEFHEEHGEGHKSYLQGTLFPEFYPNKDYYDVLVDYIWPIIGGHSGGRARQRAPRKNPDVDIGEYDFAPKVVDFFTKDYFKVCDIYGLLSCFFDVFVEKDDSGNYAAASAVRAAIKRMFVDYVWKNPTELDVEKINFYIDEIARAAAARRPVRAAMTRVIRRGGGGRGTRRRL